jgi:hypothetical protein
LSLESAHVLLIGAVIAGFSLQAKVDSPQVLAARAKPVKQTSDGSV